MTSYEFMIIVSVIVMVFTSAGFTATLVNLLDKDFVGVKRVSNEINIVIYTVVFVIALTSLIIGVGGVIIDKIN